MALWAARRSCSTCCPSARFRSSWAWIKGIPSPSVTWVSVTVAAAIGGLTAGHLLGHRINATHTRRAAIAVAALATAVAVVRGILT
jgi:hypothetical protein